MNLKFLNSSDDEKRKPIITIPVKQKVIVLMIIFIIGFIFFITSNMWLVTSKDYNSNKIYDTITVSDDISLKLRRWSFNPLTKQTEIEIGKNFSSISNNLQFTLNVLGNGINYIQATIDYDSPTMWIISLEKLPFNTKYIKLNFSVELNNTIYGGGFTMDLNSPEIDINTNLTLHKSEQEYLTQSLTYEKKKLQETLDNNIVSINEAKTNIDTYNLELENIQNNKQANLTTDEQEILNQKINNLHEEIHKLTDLISNFELQNEQLQEDISILDNKINE